MKHLVSAAVVGGLLISNGFASSYEPRSAVDLNGRTYQYVTNDPFFSRQYKLKNGLSVFLCKNDKEARIQSYIAVRAGSGDEKPESTGLAHYFEHMMFKGNSKIASLNWTKEKPLLDRLTELFELHRRENNAEKRAEIYHEIDQVSLKASEYSNSEYWDIVGTIGASGTNAWTSYDETVYVNDIPANQLERFLEVESVRFSDIALRRFHTELETVYEEFNRSQDSDFRMAYQSMMHCLFREHPYGRSVLGKPEHLKAPSMLDIQEFFHKYYVPENIALILSGKLEYEETMDLIEKTFGRLKTQNSTSLFVQREISKRLIPGTSSQGTFEEIYGPEAELCLIGYRFDSSSKNTVMMKLLSKILRNGKCGLFDEHLIRPQKIQELELFTLYLRDSIVQIFVAMPREGQSLDDVRKMIESEISAVANGDFDKDNTLIHATVNNSKLNLITSAENREGAACFVDTFITGQTHAEYLTSEEEISQITKQDISDFVKNNFASGSVIYKKNGEPKHKIKAEKPKITPVSIPTNRSEYAQSVLSMKPLPDSKPQFLDFSKIQGDSLYPEKKNFVQQYTFQNKRNERFSLKFAYPAGSCSSKKLQLALLYLQFLGTDKLTAEELNRREYELAASFEFVCTNTSSELIIEGLQSNFNESVSLFIELMKHAKQDKTAYDKLIESILKDREANAKSLEQIRFNAMNYVMYGRGKKNYNTDIFTEKELREIDPESLVELIHSLSSYQHDIVYFGPKSQVEILDILRNQLANLYIGTNELQRFPEQVKYVIDPPVENLVYFMDYPSSQASVVIARPDEIRSVPPIAFEKIYNSYANRVVMDELREKQGLAYTATAFYSIPRIFPQNYCLTNGFIGTQPDKLQVAIEGLISLTEKLPMQSELFHTVLDSERQKCISFTTDMEDAYFVQRKARMFGMEKEGSEILYHDLPRYTEKTFQEECDSHVMGKPYILLIVTNLKNISQDDFQRFGKVTILPMKEIFPEDKFPFMKEQSSHESSTPGRIAVAAMQAYLSMDLDLIQFYYDNELAKKMIAGLAQMPKNTKDEIAIMYSNYKVSLLSEKTDGETSVVELNVEDESGHIIKQVSHLTWKNNKWIVID